MEGKSASEQKAGRKEKGRWRSGRGVELCEPEMRNKEEDMARPEDTGQGQKDTLVVNSSSRVWAADRERWDKLA